MQERPVWLCGAKVWTGSGAPGGRDLPSSLLFDAGRVAAVGTEEQVGTHPAAARAERLDLKGATVLPGLTDGHAHLTSFAKQREALDLGECASLGEVLGLLRAKARELEAGAWIHGVRFCDPRWTENRLPTRQDLDSLDIPNPVFLTRVCTHVQVANTAALRAAGMDPADAPDGILHETAAYPVIQAFDAWQTGAGVEGLVEAACRDYLRFGVTEVHTCSALEYGMGESLGLFQSLRRQGRLPLRVLLYADTPPSWEMQSGFGDDWVRYGGFKFFLDGSLGGRTAWLSTPYADDPSTCGVPNHDPDEMVKKAVALHRGGVQMLIHAIGDAALDLAIRAVREANAQGPNPCGLPHRLNHVMICRDDQMEALRGMDLALDVQPSFLPSDLAMAKTRLGEERARWGYRWRDFVDLGVPVSASSDSPVEPISPFRGMWSALCRTEADGTPAGGWCPGQSLSLDQALRLFTVNPARAAGEEGRRGVLHPGAWADLSILDADLFSLPPEALRDLEVRRTYVGGELRYSRG